MTIGRNAAQGNPVSGFGYQGLAGFSTISAPEPGEAMRFGVQRYPGGLIEGQQYELSNRGTSGTTSLLLFMFDANGGLIKVNDSSWIVASSANPETNRVRFTAPTGVRSFAVQFQGPYMGGSASSFPRLDRVTDG